MKKKFRDLLHQYKVEAFKLEHHHEDEDHPDQSEEILAQTSEALNHAYHFNFHQEPSPEALETFQMIKSFTVEAILPPVIETLVRRISVLEKEQHLMVKLVDDLLEALSEDDVAQRDAG